MNLPGTPFFSYRDGRFAAEELPFDELAVRFGTPLYVYSKAALLAALAPYQQALSGHPHLVCYATKANSNLALLQLFARNGCGFDIVSAGELARVQAAGGDPAKVVFSGVGKTREEMRLALEAGIKCFNVESEEELDTLAEVAQATGRKAPVSVRVNPDVDAKTHPYISTGLKDNKFGIAHERALEVYRHALALPSLHVVGIDCHIGSQITDTAPYLDALDLILDLVHDIEQLGIHLQHIDLGGGLGITYNEETPPDAAELYRAVLARLAGRGLSDRELLVEPGRSLVGNAGALVTQVLYLKPGAKNFCVVDAAMNDLARPAMYEAYHTILPVRPRPSADALEQSYDVVGPICESGDWLGRDRQLAVKPGDYLAILSAGAYGMSMASNYNSRGRAAEVLVDGDEAHLIGEREDVLSLFAREHLLP